MLQPLIKKYKTSLSLFIDPLDLGVLFTSFICFFLFIIQQPLVVSSVPYPDMVLIEFLGYTTSQDYMNLLYSMTAFLAVGLLCCFMYFTQKGTNGLGIMVFFYLVGYIALGLSHLISLSMIIAIGCLWAAIMLSIHIYNNIKRQFLCYSFLMIASCLMPHFAISAAGAISLFLLYPLIEKKISGLYYIGQVLIMVCTLILGISCSVFMLGFDIQSFNIAGSYISGFILATLIYGLYFIMQCIIKIPRHTSLYYIFLFVPLLAIAFVAGRFTGVLI